MTDLCPVCVSPAAGAGAGAAGAGASAGGAGAGAGAGGGKFSLNDIIKVFVFVRDTAWVLWQGAINGAQFGVPPGVAALLIGWSLTTQRCKTGLGGARDFCFGGCHLPFRTGRSTVSSI